ncbi:MAG: hypothetical protein CFE24_03515 [Flavobacterium sp. BFFFF2]|nr:MAG: hypothetical protein CFE24_03515 [Flavobacterium sp. BFFFF2]
MSLIVPFQASRPVADKVSLVSCRNYDDYSPAELTAWLNFNPYTFLHVLHPAYAFSHKIGIEKRFKGVAHKYADFKEDGIFCKESVPAFYLYEIQRKSKVFTGLVAGISIDEYRQGNIKKHEDTLAYRVDILKEYLNQTQFNAEPVLITYPEIPAIDQLWNQLKYTVPLYQFSTTNKEFHRIWAVTDPTIIESIQAHFESLSALYIADGHHRMASSEKYWADQESAHAAPPFCMGFLIEDHHVDIFEFNRLIRDLNGHSIDSLIEALEKHFVVKPKDQDIWKPQSKYEFGLYANNQAYALYYKHHQHHTNDPLSSLDAQILYQTVLEPLLGIKDLRNDDRIEYMPGIESLNTLKELVDDGEYKLALLLYPATIEEIKAIADAGQIMPPKSTYIEPKFRNGLLIHEF